MPRKARITIPGAVHHVMSRGIEGRAIFISDEDRYFFLNLLETGITRSGYLLYAWCLMDNHYHLVLRVNEYPLGRFMRQLNGPYAQYFRKTSAMRGYLFQDRYKSIVTQDQVYIEELVRYVHLNPLRAGLCSGIDTLESYRWSGHSVLMGKRKWVTQNIQDVLLRFDAKPSAARRKYSAFIKQGVRSEPDLYKTLRASNDEKENIHNTGSWVIGNRDFVVKAMERYGKNASRVNSGVTVEEVAADVCRKMNIQLDTLLRKGRKSPSSKARRIVSYICSRNYSIPIREIARYLGVTSSAISNMVREGEGFMGEFVAGELSN